MLLKREYIIRNGKSLEATDKGIHLIEVVPPEVKSPAMTGQWEAYLKRIQRSAGQLDSFLHGIEEYVRDVVGKVGATFSGTTAPVALTAMKDSITAAGPSRKRRKKKAVAQSKTRAGRPEIAVAGIEEKLRSWRLAEAKRRGVPAFRIFSDQTLRALALERPATTRELVSIPGIRLGTVEKHGAQIYRILHEGRP